MSCNGANFDVLRCTAVSATAIGFASLIWYYREGLL